MVQSCGFGIRLLLAIAERRLRRRAASGAAPCCVLAMMKVRTFGGSVDVALAERIGQAERLAAFPHLERRRDMEDARAGIGRRASVEHALRAPGQRIALTRIGERKIIGRIEMVGLLAPCAHRLPEADIERHQPAADMRIGAVEGSSAALVGIEAEREKLRTIRPLCDVPSTIATLSCAIDRVRRADIVLRRIAQEGAEVAQRREAKAADRRILGAIDQFVEAAGLKAGRIADMLLVRRRRLAGFADAEAPFAVRDRLARILLAGAHGQAGQEAVGERRPVVEARRRIGIVAAERDSLDLLAQADRDAGRRPRRDHLRADDARNRRAVVVVGDDGRHADPVHAVEHVHLPAGPHQRVALRA